MRGMLTPAVAAVAVVAVAGCGVLPGAAGTGGQERQTTQAQAPTTESTPPEGTPTEGPSTEGPSTEGTESTPSEAASAPAAEQSAQPQADKVIATREVKVAGTGEATRIKVDITALLRQGKTVTLNWTVTGLEGTYGLQQAMSTGERLDWTVSGVSLIDPVNAKRYRVARNGTDDKATCVCSNTNGLFLDKDESASLYAVFAAPPADVTRINVEMPSVGVFNDVPIS